MENYQESGYRWHFINHLEEFPMKFSFTQCINQLIGEATLTKIFQNSMAWPTVRFTYLSHISPDEQLKFYSESDSTSSRDPDSFLISQFCHTYDPASKKGQEKLEDKKIFHKIMVVLTTSVRSHSIPIPWVYLTYVLSHGCTWLQRQVAMCSTKSQGSH